MSHKSKIIAVKRPASGLLAVTVRCCGDKKTDSVLTIHRLDRADDAITAAIQAHQARVEQMHGDDQRACELVKKLGARVEDCQCP
ncbi:MAG: hypothetical protein ACRESF_12005 [Pseudomonas sp.]